MSLQFPINPTEGQTYQPSGQPQIYTYSGGKWAVKYNAQTASNAAFATSASQAENSNYALTASYALNGGGGSVSASYAESASYVAILGDGITVNYSEFGIELTGSGGGGSQNLDGVLSVGRTTSGSIIMGENPYWSDNWAATASLAIGSGSLSLTSHSIALGLNSVAGNPNSVAIGNGSVTGRYLYDDNQIFQVSPSAVRWIGLGAPTPPADWFKVGKSYMLFGDQLLDTSTDVGKAAIINNVTSVELDILGRLVVNHSGLTGNDMTSISNTNPRIWIELDSAPYSFAQGEGVFSAGASQHVIGQYNSELSDAGALIVGNGSDNANRSNLLVASGDKVQITGSLWVNGTEITSGGGGGEVPGLDAVLSANTDIWGRHQGRATSGSIIMGQYGDGYVNDFTTASISIGTGSVSLNKHSIALGEYSIAANPNSFVMGKNAYNGKHLVDTYFIETRDPGQLNWRALYAPVPPADFFQVGKSYICHVFNPSSGPSGTDLKTLKINNVLSSQIGGIFGDLTVTFDSSEGYTPEYNNDTRLWFEVQENGGNFVQGEGVIAAGDWQHVTGQFNTQITDAGAFIVGNGSDDANRSNLLVAKNSSVEVSGSFNASSAVVLNGLGNYNNDIEAEAGGVPLNGVYHHNGSLKIRLS